MDNIGCLEPFLALWELLKSGLCATRLYYKVTKESTSKRSLFVWKCTWLVTRDFVNTPLPITTIKCLYPLWPLPPQTIFLLSLSKYKVIGKIRDKSYAPSDQIWRRLVQSNFLNKCPIAIRFFWKIHENVTYRRITLGSTQGRLQDAFLRKC